MLQHYGVMVFIQTGKRRKFTNQQDVTTKMAVVLLVFATFSYWSSPVSGTMQLLKHMGKLTEKYLKLVLKITWEWEYQ